MVKRGDFILLERRDVGVGYIGSAATTDVVVMLEKEGYEVVSNLVAFTFGFEKSLLFRRKRDWVFDVCLCRSVVDLFLHKHLMKGVNVRISHGDLYGTVVIYRVLTEVVARHVVSELGILLGVTSWISFDFDGCVTRFTVEEKEKRHDPFITGIGVIDFHPVFVSGHLLVVGDINLRHWGIVLSEADVEGYRGSSRCVVVVVEHVAAWYRESFMEALRGLMKRSKVVVRVSTVEAMPDDFLALFSAVLLGRVGAEESLRLLGNFDATHLYGAGDGLLLSGKELCRVETLVEGCTF